MFNNLIKCLLNMVSRNNELIRNLYNEIIKSSFQIFLYNSEGKYQPVGSGVFINLNDKYYYITAAHVLDEGIKNLFVFVGDEGITLGGKLFITDLPKNQDRENDKIDVAIFKINDEHIEKLNKYYTFIKMDDISINHRFIEARNYLIVGYPGSQTKKKYIREKLK